MYSISKNDAFELRRQNNEYADKKRIVNFISFRVSSHI